MTFGKANVLATVAAVVFFVAGMHHARKLGTEEPRVDLVLAARLELEARSVAGGRIALTWKLHDFSGAIQKYEYQNGPLGGPSGTWTAIDKPKGRRLTIGGLKNGLIYGFRMRATDENDVAYLSNQAIAAAIQLDTPEPVTSSELCDGRQLGVILFERGRHEIDEGFGDNQASLEGIKGTLREGVGADRLVLVAGYASAQGRASYNLDLSEKRAWEIVRHLESLQRVGGRFVPLAMGERPGEAVLDRAHESHRKVVVKLCDEDTPS